jgi:hypothetical protein
MGPSLHAETYSDLPATHEAGLEGVGSDQDLAPPASAMEADITPAERDADVNDISLLQDRFGNTVLQSAVT